MKLKTLRGNKARKETRITTVTRGTMKRRETRMKANNKAVSRDTMLTKRIESPRLKIESKGWSFLIKTWPNSDCYIEHPQ